MSDQEKNLKDEELDKVSGGVANTANIGSEHVYHRVESAAGEGKVSLPIEVPKSAADS